MRKKELQLQGHELFHFTTCPYCVKVRLALRRMKLDIPLRNINRTPAFKRQLMEGGGKKQVPCLRIEERAGEVRWLYESDAIIRYFKTKIVKPSSKKI